MNKSLKFLAIGLALAVLLVSQVGVDRTAEAEVTLKDGNIEFTNELGDEVSRLKKDFFKPGDTANFFLKDSGLAEPTTIRQTTVTWSLDAAGAGQDVEIGDVLSLVTGEITDRFGDSADTFSTTTDSLTAHAGYAPAGDASATPLDGDPVVKVNGAKRAIDSVDASDGTFQFLREVDVVSSGTTTIEAVFRYHVADMFEKSNKGTGAEDNENRVRVFSESDPVGAWLTITEVENVGTTVTAPTTDIYHGSVVLTDDPRDAVDSRGVNDPNDEMPDMVSVRDGDTLTVEYYQDNHTTVIASDTATIDDEDPAIVSIEAEGGPVTNDDSPAVRFTVSDDGSGFDTSAPKLHVTLDIGGCEVPDSDLIATGLTGTEITMLYRSDGDWSDGLDCAPGTSFTADTESIVEENSNNHGTEFTIMVTVEDGAGNMSDDDIKLTIDTSAPSFDQNNTETGVGWDPDKDKETKDRASIRLAFNESLQVDSVDADDFEVENPDVTVEDVIVGGVNVKDGAQQENERVYLVLSSELSSDARPRVVLDGSVMDIAGNELEESSIARVNDGIKPGVEVDPLSAKLLVSKGEADVSFSADENLAAAAAAIDKGCTCLGINGGGGTQTDLDTERGPVTLPTPSKATYTFKVGSRGTGIYGILVQASDSAANVESVGAEKASNEEITIDAADVTSDGVVLSLKKWPLADAGFTGSLAGAVKVSLSSGGDAVSTSTVTSVDWGAGTVTMDLGDVTDEVDADTSVTVFATYSYVNADQVVEIDLDAPGLAEDDGVLPSGDTQEARPFITITFDETEYAGDTHTTVEVTSAVLTDPNDNDTVLVDAENDVNLLSTSDNKMFSYLPSSDLELGEYTLSVIAEDDAGNVMDEASRKFKVVARPPVTIPLNLGWNLVSLPGAAADSSIDAVINVDAVSQVLTYDPTVEGGWLAAVRVNGAFEGGLTNIEASKAYLVYTTSVDDLKVDIPGFAQGTQDFPPTIQVHEGWNMIPASSLDPKFEVTLDTYLASISWTRGYYYGASGRIVPVTHEENDVMVTTGRGFLIYVEEDGTLVP